MKIFCKYINIVVDLQWGKKPGRSTTILFLKKSLFFQYIDVIFGKIKKEFYERYRNVRYSKFKHKMSFEPTYKELKHFNVRQMGEADNCFEPTYKELKRRICGPLEAEKRSFEPTYKELKPFLKCFCFFLCWKVLSLPIRNWNPIVGTVSHHIHTSFEPTYKELKRDMIHSIFHIFTSFWAYL